MSVSIIHADGVITPLAVTGYESGRVSGNIIHTIPGRPTPDVTLRPALLRAATLHLVFGEETASRDAENVHAAGTVFTMLSENRPTVEMVYVVADRGRITRRQGTAGDWLVDVDYQEVATA